MLFDRGDLWWSLVVCGENFGRRSVEADALAFGRDGSFLIAASFSPVGNEASLEGAT